MPRPWEPYKVGTPETPPFFAQDCCLLTTVSHVAHIPTAVRIIEDKKLKADLVFDDSILNSKRIRVVWISPNHWHRGFRYGNIEFKFDWRTLVEGKKYYWVETMPYSPIACRILISQKIHEDLIPYNPKDGDGPWWLDAEGNHYWNGSFCLEFMLEEDIDLHSATLGFVDHHQFQCCLDSSSCRYRNRRFYEGGAEFIATLASEGKKVIFPGLTEEVLGSISVTSAMSWPLGELRDKCEELQPSQWGSMKGLDPKAEAIARAILRALYVPTIQADCIQLAGNFESTVEMMRAINKTIDKSLEQ